MNIYVVILFYISDARLTIPTEHPKIHPNLRSTKFTSASVSRLTSCGGWFVGCFSHFNNALGIQSSCQRMIWVYNHLLNKVFRFHYHYQKVIGSLGMI